MMGGGDMEKTRVFLYCRVAHDDGFSLEAQAATLRRYAEQAGYSIVGASSGCESGMTLDRPALQEVTRAVLAGEVDLVLVQSITRIGREWGMAQGYINLLAEHKVKLLCIRDQLLFNGKNPTRFSDNKNAECPL